ncbi:MAG: PEP/pyruvate-binding domain-containing protein [Armatimonadota bacterium]
MVDSITVHSGIAELDAVLQGLRLGDNVVWQVDSLDDYRYFVVPFVEAGLALGYHVVYLRFAPHAPVLTACEGIEVIEVDPSPGFDYFSRAVHQIIDERGSQVLYVFDNLSFLVEEWATDELLANFFQVTCPFLFELDTVTYFALTRGQHAHSAVARVRDTTQVLIDVYHVKTQMYVHPLKVWDRYSPSMFLPHLVSKSAWAPVYQSSDAAEVALTARRFPLQGAPTSTAPWESVYHRLLQYQATGRAAENADPELAALTQELCHMLIGAQPEISELADQYFTLDDLLNIRSRMVGSGRIGGKAAGMLLARRILSSPAEETGVHYAEILEGHDSFFIGSDVFFTFLVHNDLFRLRLQLSKSSRLTWEEFEEVEERFLAGNFSAPIMEQFRNLLDYYGQAPIIVRSSSLLEDSFGNAFAGKYRSEFCVNQGDPEERLEAFMRAVKLVYASALNPDALSYRRKRGLGESDEQMAILVQRVSGRPHGQWFYPSLSGVAFSRNLYAWSDRIDPRQGMIRLVFGLGTRAVERVGNDYPRIIAVSSPELRPEVGQKIAKYSQREVDLLDLQNNALVTVPSYQALAGPDLRDIHYLISVMHDGYPYDPISNYLEDAPHTFILTFNNLIRKTPFVKLLGAMLARLETAYGRPIDTEFTATVEPGGEIRLNLLQCRPLFMPGASDAVAMRRDLPRERILFRSTRMIRGGAVRQVRYLLYIDPRQYSAADIEMKRSLGRLVGRLNDHPAIVDGNIIMMGPGRWGSSNIDLGVNVGYGDIDNAAVLVEVGREDAGQLPEVSYGTHFFQDLVEAQIIFLAVYPDDPKTEFQESFFGQAPNSLLSLLPDAAAFADLVQVIDVPAVAAGMHAHLIADSQSNTALCYIE